MQPVNEGHSLLLKSNDDLMIGGYASIEIVDKQNDLITLKALEEAVDKFMSQDGFRNVMTNHSNVQVGEVIKEYRDKNGRLWKTGVDDVGFFVVIKLRDDIEKAKEINRGIRKGSLRSFSIGGQALRKVKKSHPEMGQYNEISKLELHEVTICEKGINPEAKFDILKQEVNKMSKMEKALAELDALMSEVDALRKEEEKKETEEMMEMAEPEEESMDSEDKEMAESEEMGNYEAGAYQEDKALVPTVDGAGVEIGEPANRIVISGGKPTGGSVTKAFANDEFRTLSLDNATIEKAYEQYRQEQLEKLAYENLEKSFEARFNEEVANREALIEKQNYDAQAEIATLKEEFSNLAKSLVEEKNAIVKAQEESVVTLPNIEEVAEMSWSDIHKMVGGI